MSQGGNVGNIVSAPGIAHLAPTARVNSTEFADEERWTCERFILPREAGKGDGALARWKGRQPRG
jgi:hypothetical protein